MKTLSHVQPLRANIFLSRKVLARMLVVLSVLWFAVSASWLPGQYARAEEAVSKEASAMARKLQLEGTQLQLKGKLREAVQKYEESLSYKPNPRLEKLVETLDKQIQRKEQETAAAPVEQAEKPEAAVETATPGAAPPGALSRKSAPSPGNANARRARLRSRRT